MVERPVPPCAEYIVLDLRQNKSVEKIDPPSDSYFCFCFPNKIFTIQKLLHKVQTIELPTILIIITISEDKNENFGSVVYIILKDRSFKVFARA